MRDEPPDHNDAGTIMVDALVAVVIVSLMIAACVLSLNLSHRLAAQTRQARQARLLLTALLETVPHAPGAYSGTRGGLSYQVTIRVDGDSGLCRVDAETTGARVFRMTATRWCQVETAA